MAADSDAVAATEESVRKDSEHKRHSFAGVAAVARAIQGRRRPRSRRTSLDAAARGRPELLRSFTADEVISKGEAVDELAQRGFFTLLHVFGGVLQLGSEEDEGGEEELASFDKEVDQARLRLKRRSRGLLNPRHPRMQYWDLLMSFSLLFVVFVTPFEVAFVSETNIGLLFFINQLVNTLFFFDVIITFVLIVDENGTLIKSHSEIAKRYLRSWFAVDIISIFPFDLLYLAGAFGTAVDPSALRAIRIVRLARLVKLLRIVRGSRIVQRWQDTIGLASTTRAAFFWVFMIFTVLHWIACLWKLVATTIQEAPARTPAVELLVLQRMDTDFLCYGCVSSVALEERDERMLAACAMSHCSTKCEIEEAASLYGVSVPFQASQESWICRFTDVGHVPPPSDLLGNYMMCLYSAVAMLAGNAATPPTNNIETSVVSFVNLLGLFLWAIVQGVVCAMLSTGNPLESEYKSNLDAINFLMSDMKLPQELRRRMRAYMRSTKDTKKRVVAATIIEKNFSSELQGEIRFNMAGHLLAKSVPFFKSVLDAGDSEYPNYAQFFEQVSARVHRESFAPQEVIPGPTRGLFVITQGVGAKSGEVMLQGQSFGHDCIVTSPALRDNRPVSCLTYVEVAMVTREDLLATIAKPQFSAIRKHIVRTALLRATLRSIVLCSLYQKMTADAVERRASAMMSRRDSAGAGLIDGGRVDEEAGGPKAAPPDATPNAAAPAGPAAQKSASKVTFARRASGVLHGLVGGVDGETPGGRQKSRGRGDGGDAADRLRKRMQRSQSVLHRAGVPLANVADEDASLSSAMKAVFRLVAHRDDKESPPVKWRELSRRVWADLSRDEKQRFTERANSQDDDITDYIVVDEGESSGSRRPRVVYVLHADTQSLAQSEERGASPSMQRSTSRPAAAVARLPEAPPPRPALASAPTSEMGHEMGLAPVLTTAALSA